MLPLHLVGVFYILIEAIGQGAAGSWSINNLGVRIAKRDFNPGFIIWKLLYKNRKGKSATIPRWI